MRGFLIGLGACMVAAGLFFWLLTLGHFEPLQSVLFFGGLGLIGLGVIASFVPDGRPTVILWTVVLVIALIVVGAIGINRFTRAQGPDGVVNDFCDAISNHNLQAAYKDLSQSLKGEEDELYNGSGTVDLIWAWGCSLVGSINDLHQGTISIDTSGSCGGGTFLVNVTLVQEAGGVWKIDQLSPETPNPCQR